ncbi:MAG: hypothetical protein ACYDAJ_10915 [Nitrosotalea sp.]
MKKDETFCVEPTDLEEHDSTDYIVTLKESDRQRLSIRKKDYVVLEKCDKLNSEYEKVSILAYAMPDTKRPTDQENKLQNQSGKIGVDQTLRDALDIEVGDGVKVLSFNRRRSLLEGLIARLDFQKAVVQVAEDPLYKEHKTPIVCLCDEMVSAIGANYGDKIHVESLKAEGKRYKIRKITARCVKLDSSMQCNHDKVVGLKNVHPIFMDKMMRKYLNVDNRYPVKIRKSWQWQVMRKLNKFGNVSLIAFSVILTALIGQFSSVPLWIALIGFLSWGIWSILTSSKYRSQMEI